MVTGPPVEMAERQIGCRRAEGRRKGFGLVCVLTVARRICTPMPKLVTVDRCTVGVLASESSRAGPLRGSGTLARRAPCTAVTQLAMIVKDWVRSGRAGPALLSGNGQGSRPSTVRSSRI